MAEINSGQSRVEVVTVATRPDDPGGNGHLELLETSCRASGLGLKILGMGQEWRGFGTKLILLREYLESVSDEQLILFADAFDVIVLARGEQLLERFQSFRAPIVFSAELGCWPHSHLAPRYPQPRLRAHSVVDARINAVRPPPPPQQLRHRYLNSGAFIGHAGPIRDVIRELAPAPEDDDQGLLTHYFLDHPELIALDYEATLFLSLFGVDPCDLKLEPDSWVFRYRLTNTHPCLLHGNGYGISTLLRSVEILRQSGWPAPR